MPTSIGITKMFQIYTLRRKWTYQKPCLFAKPFAFKQIIASEVWPMGCIV